MKRSSASTKRQGVKQKPAGSQASQEVVAFTAAVLRQMDHAANLVAAFFRNMSMLDGNGVTLSALLGSSCSNLLHYSKYGSGMLPA